MMNICKEATDPKPGGGRCGAEKKMNGRCMEISWVMHLQGARRRCQAVWLQTGLRIINNAYTTKMQYPFNFNCYLLLFYNIFQKNAITVALTAL